VYQQFFAPVIGDGDATRMLLRGLTAISEIAKAVEMFRLVP
jgi:hypothetical protein